MKERSAENPKILSFSWQLILPATILQQFRQVNLLQTEKLKLIFLLQHTYLLCKSVVLCSLRINLKPKRRNLYLIFFWFHDGTFIRQYTFIHPDVILESLCQPLQLKEDLHIFSCITTRGGLSGKCLFYSDLQSILKLYCGNICMSLIHQCGAFFKKKTCDPFRSTFFLIILNNRLIN